MDTMFGTKVYDTNKKQVAVVIKTYKLGYVDSPDAMGAHIIAPDGTRYPQNMDYLIPISELTDEEIQKYYIPQGFLID